MKPHLSFLLWITVCCLPVSPLWASDTAAPKETPAQWMSHLVPEFLWTGSWETRHNLTDRMDIKVTVPQADIALRLEALDRRPASKLQDFTESFGGETANKAITHANFGLYHLPSNTRLLYGTLDYFGLSARIRNVWIRGAPYPESRAASSAEIKTEPSSTAKQQLYGCFESPEFSLGTGTTRVFVSYSESADLDTNQNNPTPALVFGADYTIGKSDFRLEGLYARRVLPERKSSTWFNEKPALPERDTRLFAGTASVSVPAFGVSADLACSETFAFGRDYYGNLGIRIGNNPWRFSLALDAAGSRYVDSAGNVPGAGCRAAVRLDRRSKKNGLIRVSAQVRGTGPAQGVMQALQSGDFAAFAEGTNRITGELYCRLPVSSGSGNPALFGLTRFSVSVDRDSRNEKKVLDTAKAMAAFALGPVNSTTEGSISGINRDKSAGMNGNGHQFDSYRISQSFYWTFPLPAEKIKEKESEKKKEKLSEDPVPVVKTKKPAAVKKMPLTVQLSAKAGYEKTEGKEGAWDTSFSASLRSRKNRISLKAALLSEKWEFTLGWRLSL